MVTMQTCVTFFTKVKRFCIVLFVACFMGVQAHNTQVTFKEPLVVRTDKTTCMSNNSTVFVQDNNKNTFVIKSYRNPEQAIHEAFGSHIGASVGMRINKVKIIPSNVPFVGKVGAGGIPATIHTCVPGEEVRNIKTMNLCIEGGLACQKHWQSLVTFNELCDVVALDIFLNNWDRHNGNLFFDEVSGHFYIIDMDQVFCQAYNIRPINSIICTNNLAQNSHEFLTKLNHANLSTKSIETLSCVRDSLGNLMKQYSPENLYDLWMDFAQEAQHTYNQPKKEYIRELIYHNYNHSLELLDKLDHIIQSTN